REGSVTEPHAKNAPRSQARRQHPRLGGCAAAESGASAETVKIVRSTKRRERTREATARIPAIFEAARAARATALRSVITIRDEPPSLETRDIPRTNAAGQHSRSNRTRAISSFASPENVFAVST